MASRNNEKKTVETGQLKVTGKKPREGEGNKWFVGHDGVVGTQELRTQKERT